MNERIIRMAVAAWACSFLLLAAARAEDKVESYFNPKINTWAEGVILSLDADSQKFSIRGCKKAYATTYAQMMQDIDAKTKKLTGAERTTKEEEVRKAWQPKLEAAQKQKADPDSDFSFALPASPNTAKVYDERGHYGKKVEKKDDQTAPTELSKSEAEALNTLKAFKIGDTVTVGYESGLITNTAWAIVRISARTTASGNRFGSANERMETASDEEITRRIRSTLAADDSLSPDARYVTVQTQKGSVVLTGQVKNEDEKQTVAAKAASVVGEANVNCQVTVAGR